MPHFIISSLRPAAPSNMNLTPLLRKGPNFPHDPSIPLRSPWSWIFPSCFQFFFSKRVFYHKFNFLSLFFSITLVKTESKNIFSLSSRILFPSATTYIPPNVLHFLWQRGSFFKKFKRRCRTLDVGIMSVSCRSTLSLSKCLILLFHPWDLLHHPTWTLLLF